ncbi:hypothetical protein Mapa_011837 [Marchantia paleacea]|nr:hypothetical protein Mapa_011837 [Marchantia paleacea]
MATIRLVAMAVGRSPVAADTPKGAGAGASVARATPTLDTATAATKTLVKVDATVEAILSVCQREGKERKWKVMEQSESWRVEIEFLDRVQS